MRPFFISLFLLVAILSISPRVAAEAPPSRWDAAFRVFAGTGALKERTDLYPGVDLVGTLRLGASGRGFVDLRLGYVPVDNHTYLADGRMYRLIVGGGARLLDSGALRLSGSIAVHKVSYYADPDGIAEHPGVDPRLSRGGFVPALGMEASYDLTDSFAIGLFSQAALTELVLLREGDVDPQAPPGEEVRARLVAGGIFFQLRIH